MAVNDTNVRMHINRALAMFAAEPNFPVRLSQAFRQLQAERRRPGGSADEDLAAAEHYMFARQAVANNAVSVTQMRTMTYGYESIKFGLNSIGLGSLLQTTSNPTAPPSEGSLRWGWRGCADGEADRLTYLPGSTPPTINPAFYNIF